MNKRIILSRLIRVMLIVLGLAFVFILLRSVSGPALMSNSSATFDDIHAGQTALRRFESKKVWVTRLSKIQIRQATKLSVYMRDASAGCSSSIAICVVSSETSRSGIDVAYSDTAPAQLPRGWPWYGGYVDPVSGAVFDRLGRAYKDIKTSDQRISLDIVNN